MNSKQEELSFDSFKIPMTNAERKAKQRAKEKAKIYGTFQESFLEKAKFELKNNLNYDLAVLLENENFSENLSENEKKQLKIFIANNKQKEKKELSQEAQKEQMQLNIKEKAQRIGNQSIPLLHQALLSPSLYEERKQLIKKKIEENLFLFIEYMETYQSPIMGFLETILDLYEEFDEDTSSKLFIRVCATHKGEPLNINDQMALTAMKYLIENKTHSIAAYGLLRLVYQNDISFFNFPIQLLIGFQQQYEQTILNFVKSIPKLSFQVIDSLPSTCFCFTRPLLKSFRDGSDILHIQVPYIFLPYLIEILCYSFTNDDQSFLNFLQIFKKRCKKLYDILLQCDFDNLLQALTEKTKSMNYKFFRTLTYHTQILERSFDLLSEKKIEKFDTETIQLLLDQNQESYQIMKQRPKIIKEGSKNLIQSLIKQLIDRNQIICNDLQNIDVQLTQEQKNIFKQMDISNLLPVQQICYKFCILDELNGIYFMQYETGQGKTSICLAVAATLVKRDHTVIILNKSYDLTFRDFKKPAFFQKNQKQKLFFQMKIKNQIQKNHVYFTQLQNS